MDAAELTGLVRRLADGLAAVDLRDASATEAEAVLADAVRLGNVARHLATAAARRVGETGAHRRTGDRTEAHYLARVGGEGVGAARRALSTNERLDALHTTRGAVERGELSPRQAHAISEAALLDRSAETRLIRMAKSRSIGELEEECARIRAAAAPEDEDERHRRARRERGCWQRRRPDGSAEIRYRSSADEVAEAWATVTAFREAHFRGLAAGGPREGFDAHCADGFLAMARAAASVCGSAAQPSTGDPRTYGVSTAGAGAGSSGAASEPTLPIDGLTSARPKAGPAKVIVRVDWDALLRGYPCAGDVCEIAGLGPVPVAAVRDMIRTGDPFLAAVVTKGTDVVSVAHLGRTANAHQVTALQWQDLRCHAEGCDRTIGLELDHTVPWADTKVTLLGLLDWLCTHHHDLKSHKDWALVGGKGIRPFVPPDDPRHPTRAGPVAADR